jgi:hypothetical protein
MKFNFEYYINDLSENFIKHLIAQNITLQLTIIDDVFCGEGYWNLDIYLTQNNEEMDFEEVEDILDKFDVDITTFSDKNKKVVEKAQDILTQELKQKYPLLRIE